MRKLLLAAALLAASSAQALAYYDVFIGEVRALPYDFCPKDWAPAWGQTISINQNHVLFALLGTRYGGDGRETFALPDLRGAALVSKDEHGKKPVAPLMWCIAMKGNFPERP